MDCRDENEVDMDVSETDGRPPSSSGRQQSTFSVCGTRFEVDIRYDLARPLGYGAYGVVCAAVDRKTNSNVAIKKLSKVFSNLIQTKRILRELRLLRYFSHENIISVLDVMRPSSSLDFDDVYIVSELMDTDLQQIISSSQPLSNEHVQYFIYQILRGVLYIHSAGVLHRDLKPGNILINGNCDLKICDFGMARVATPECDHNHFMTEYVATRWYRAPEIMLSWKEYSKAIDTWSIGCILAELLGRRPLFPGRDYMHQLHLIIDTLGSPSQEDMDYIGSDKARDYIRSLPLKQGIRFSALYPNADHNAIDLLEKMLQFAPEKRITIVDALNHPYLKSLHDPYDEPVATSTFDFTFETEALDSGRLRELLLEEIAHYYAECT